MKIFVAFCLLLAAFSAAAFGQASAINGSIQGTITDPTGAVVPEATVRARNIETGFTATVKTADSGFYRFNVLPLGTYEVTAEATGFATVRQTGVTLNAGANQTLDFALQVNQSASTVEVTAAPPITTPDRLETGNTLTTNEIRNLPLVSRNPYNFILMQPNVSGRINTEFGVPRKINANGFNGRINYELDGSNNTESDRAGIRLLPISNTWIQEIQQVSNGFAPEFGNTVGTVFNTITRSGTNDFHGEGGYIFRRTPFSARPKLTPASSPTPEVNVDNFLGDVGGPIVKDRAFFFGSYEHVKRDLPAPVAVPAATIAQLGLPANYADPIPFSQNVTFFLGKVDYQIGSNNRLSVRYNGHRNDSPYNNSSIGGLFLTSQSYNFVDRSQAGAIQLVSTLSPNAINELRVQIANRSQRQVTFSGSGTGPTIAISGVANFGGPTGAGFEYSETTPEVAEAFSYNAGSHALKFGGGLRGYRDTQIQATFAQFNFADIASYLAAASGANPRGYSTFQQTLGNPSMSYNSTFWNGFAQDNWKLRRNILVSYGIRYDLFKVPEADVSSPFEFSKQFRTDKNNWAPRLGVAIGLGKDQKTVLRASGGIFYDQPQTDQYRRAILNNGSPIFFSASGKPSDAWTPSFPNAYTSVPTGFNLPRQDITTVSPDFATLYSINGNVSITRELTTNMALTASYFYTRGNRLPVYRNINLVPSGSYLADGRPIFSATARVYPQFNNITVVESVGQSTYNAGNLTLNKRWAHGFDLYGSWTWSHAIDDAPEQNNIDSSNLTLSDPTNRRRDRGDSLTDKRHSFNLTGVFAPTVDTSNRAFNALLNHNVLSTSLVAATGDAFNMGSNRTLNNDTSAPTAVQRPVFVGRNTLRGPAIFELNARYSRRIPFGERWAGELFAESTNVTNTLNVTGINSTATVDTLGFITRQPTLAATGARDQRLLQFGVRVTF